MCETRLDPSTPNPCPLYTLMIERALLGASFLAVALLL